MTQTNMFDPHAMIQWLAEVEQECPCYPNFENCHKLFARVEAGESQDILYGTHYRSPCICDGTGIVAPFAALRVECPIYVSHNLHHEDGTPIPAAHTAVCVCKGKAWVAERDVEKARWKVFAALPALIRHEVARHPDDVFQVAEAWVKTQPTMQEHPNGEVSGYFIHNLAGCPWRNEDQGSSIWPP